MITRRQSMKGGLAAAAAASLPMPAVWAQGKPMLKVRYNEVVRSILYAPAYVAISKGFLKDAGIDAELTTAQGGDKSMAALLGGAADIALMGPETAVYILNGESPVKARIFCGLTATDGFMLLGREKQAKFEWSSLKGKEILGFRPGSTPLLYLEAALRKNGIDPLKDVKLNNNVAIPARVGSWHAGQNQFGIFIEPDAAQLEIDGKGFFCASIGETVGPADYTAFMATDTYIKANGAVVQSWTDAIAKAMKWTQEAPVAELAAVLQPYFPGITPQAMTAASERYRRLKIWKSTPVIEQPAIERFQDILVQGNVLEQSKRVKFSDLILTEYAAKAK